MHVPLFVDGFRHVPRRVLHARYDLLSFADDGSAPGPRGGVEAQPAVDQFRPLARRALRKTQGARRDLPDLRGDLLPPRARRTQADRLDALSLHRRHVPRNDRPRGLSYLRHGVWALDVFRLAPIIFGY